MIENSLGFIYSEKLYSKELSPLEFLSLDVVSRNIDGNRQLLSGIKISKFIKDVPLFSITRNPVHKARQ